MRQPNGNHVRARYKIAHEGENIGTIYSERRIGEWSGAKAVVVTDELDIRVERFLNNYTLHTRETITLTDAGLVCYSGVSVEDGKRSSVEATLADNGLTMAVEEDGESYKNILANSQFDASSEEVVDRFIVSGEASKTLRVIDLDDFEVVKTEYRNEGRTEVEIAGEGFISYVVSFNSSRKKGRQWLTADDTGTWLLKEEGTDNEGPYCITLTGYERMAD